MRHLFARSRLLFAALVIGLLSCFGPPSLAVAAPVQARTFHNVFHEMSVDQFGPLTVNAPHAVLQGLRAETGIAAYSIARHVGLDTNVAAPAAVFASGFVPHIVGVARGSYKFNGKDWLADGVIGGSSAYVARAFERRQRRLVTTAAYLTGWALVARSASP